MLRDRLEGNCAGPRAMRAGTKCKGKFLIWSVIAIMLLKSLRFLVCAVRHRSSSSVIVDRC